MFDQNNILLKVVSNNVVNESMQKSHIYDISLHLWWFYQFRLLLHLNRC